MAYKPVADALPGSRDDRWNRLYHHVCTILGLYGLPGGCGRLSQRNDTLVWQYGIEMGGDNGDLVFSLIAKSLHAFGVIVARLKAEGATRSIFVQSQHHDLRQLLYHNMAWITRIPVLDT